MKLSTLTIFLAASVFFTSCGNNGNNSAADDPKYRNKSEVTSTEGKIREEKVSFTAMNQTYDGFIAYDDSKQGARPAILVLPEWWGLNDYVRNRAKQLAQLGYIAMAVDMYGDGKVAANPKEAQALATPYYKDPMSIKPRIDAALALIKERKQADTANVAAIGYCFGGYIVLNAAKLGENLKGVVTFHGDLSGLKPDKNLLKAKVLVCHGEADKMVSPQVVNTFKKQMDSIGADYTFKTYANATHAFTNPDATSVGKTFNLPIQYNAAADTASWNDMKVFFSTLFGK